MARSLDERRRAELVELCLPYLAEHGVASMSLRPLAAAVGTSDRMLIHYFGSKEALIGRVLAETRPDVVALTATDDVRVLAERVWSELRNDGPQRVRVRLLLEIMALALTQPELYRDHANAAVHAWVMPVADALGRTAGISRREALARAGALVSGLRGIALDRYLTGDLRRTDDAAKLLIAATTSSPT